MFNDQGIDPQKVLVELSVITLGGNGNDRDQVTEVLSIANKTGLFHVQTNSGTCIEGEWNDICPLIYESYERIQEHSPGSFLKISIR